MGWRTLLIENSHKVSLKLDNLKIEDMDRSYMLPLKDIDTIILNNYKMYMTVQLLCKLSHYNINVIIIICEKNGMPTVVVNPLAGNYSTFHYQKLQLNISNAVKQKIWKNIIKQKIHNQMLILDCFTRSMEAIEFLITYENEVDDDDSTNREGLAAKVYFKALFGEKFFREQDGDDAVNIMLNYGYALVRAYVARALAAKGLILSLGIKHKNIYNHFNLVDDVMEPFRPIVDYWVYKNIVERKNDFCKDSRESIVRFLCNVPISVDNRQCKLQTALEKHVDTFIAVLSGERDVPLFPVIQTELWSDICGGL